MSQNTAARLCFLLEGYLPIVNGASVHLSRLIPYLSARGAETTIISRLAFPDDKPLEQTSDALIVKVGPRAGMKRRAKFLMLPGVFFALVRHRTRYDTIVVCDLKVLGIVALLAAKLLGKKCILRAESCGEIDGSYGTKYRDQKMSFWKWCIYTRIVRFRNVLLRGSDGFLCICSAIEAEFVRGRIPMRLLIRTTNGVDTTFFTPATPERRADVRKKLGVADDELLFIYTGRISAGKGLEYLTEAWIPFQEAHKGKLFVVGGGLGFTNHLEIRLREFVEENRIKSSIIFTGKVGNVVEYLQAADVFVLPSQSEATSLSLLEAMSCGLPSIVTAVDGNLDLVQDDQNGLLVPYQNHQALLDAMLALAESAEDRARLGAAARASTIDRNDAPKVAETYLNLGKKS